MKKKTAAVAILVCAVMALVAAAPLVTADTHHVVKGAQGPRASAVSWNFVPPDNGSWSGHVVNSGLRSLVVDVDDVTSGVASSILHQRIRFAAYPTNTLDTKAAVMALGHTYTITVTPNGPRGTFCDVDDVFVIMEAPIASFTVTVNGATVSVDGSASMDPDGTIVAWGWEWGDGTTGTGVTATHTYAVSGDYTIVLTVMDNDGLTNSTSKTVTVVVPDNPPVASFTATVSGLSVSVDASASTDDHGIVSYDWNFGDGMTGSGVTATHTYAAEGTYTITLTVTDTIGQTASASQDVSVAPIPDLPPVAAFTATVTEMSVSVDASASSDDNGIVSYDWTFGDGATGTGVISTHTYAAEGTYTITLTVTDTIGQTGSVSHDVVISVIPPDQPPVAAFTGTVSGYSVSVDASGSTDDIGIAAFSWNWGDGSPAGSGVTATHTYTNVPPLLKTITLTVTDTIGQTNSVSHGFTLQDAPPVAAFTATVSGYTVSVDGSASTDDHGIVSYAWIWGDGSPAGSGVTATHTYASGPLLKTIGLTVEDTVGQTASVSHDLTLQDAPPVAAFTATPSGYTVSVDASASTDDHGITSYAWNWGDGSPAGSGVTATHTYTNVPPLLKTISLTVTDTVGQTASVSHDVTLQDSAPVAAFTATPSGYSVSVDASASTDDHGITSYSWNWGDGSPAGSGVTATHTYTNVPPLLKSITLTVTDTVGQTASVSKDVTLIDNPPVAAFTATVSGYSVSVDASTSTDDHGIASYAWNWGDGSPAGSGVTATHTYTNVPPLLKTISLTVTDTIGQTASVSHDATLQDSAPVAAFTVTKNNLDVSVDAAGSTDDHGIVSFAWNWDDGSPAGSGMVATHTYAAAGTYSIMLTLTDTVGQTASVSQDVTVSSGGVPPVAAFTGVTASGGMLTVDGSTSSSTVGIARYDWNFGDNIIATGVTHVHKYVATGAYVVTLTVTDTLGQKASVTHSFSVVNTALPPLPFTVYGFLTSGGSPIAGEVSVTNVRTGETLIGNLADDTGFYYVNDVMPLYFIQGDTMIVSAVSGALTGSTSLVPDFSGQPFLQVDVGLF